MVPRVPAAPPSVTQATRPAARAARARSSPCPARHNERVISLDLATTLRDAGLSWAPEPGDRFAIPDRGLDDQVFVLSDMTIEVHHRPEGTVIGFNGTTEWALDDVDQDEAVWLPREDQLRGLLGPSFRRLERQGDAYVVIADVGAREALFGADSPEDAYGKALLTLIAG
jgi:hypothetical protein